MWDILNMNTFTSLDVLNHIMLQISAIVLQNLICKSASIRWLKKTMDFQKNVTIFGVL